PTLHDTSRKWREALKTLLNLLGSHRGGDASRSRHHVGKPIRGLASLAGSCAAGPGLAAAPPFSGPNLSAASIEFRPATIPPVGIHEFSHGDRGRHKRRFCRARGPFVRG